MKDTIPGNKRLYYEATFTDPLIPSNTYVVTEHAAGLPLIYYDGEDLGKSVMYIAQEDVIGIVVALLVNSGLVNKDNTRRHSDDFENATPVMQAAIALVNEFREGTLKEGMKERLLKNIGQAKDDWDAKIAATNIINEYENLRGVRSPDRRMEPVNGDIS